MPELPEVETIARTLRQGGRNGPAVLGKVIDSATVFWLRSIAVPDAVAFSSRVAGQEICSIGRRAKYLVFGLSIDSLLVHLRMSGDIRVEDDKKPTQPHDRLHILFQDGMRMAFNDPRKFGRVWLTVDPQHMLDGLGPEPLDGNLSVDDFFAMLQKTRRQIKPLLLDQKFIAGVGNIYSDEALHRAGIHPLTPAKQLDREAAARLLGAVRETLEEGIRRNGASIDWVYRGGDFQNHFRVYQRDGEACPVCGSLIDKKTIGQRSAHFCPVCQPAP
jgi:formamidopyrimidine-DNA glycosylase